MKSEVWRDARWPLTPPESIECLDGVNLVPLAPAVQVFHAWGQWS
ncbi:hypothetical protein SynA1825c_02741 [Synechococcus sp. A18-25c]|nr:hypothetical protein SynA1825c_02741 [Synechococcus sp. A18-25c]